MTSPCPNCGYPHKQSLRCSLCGSVGSWYPIELLSVGTTVLSLILLATCTLAMAWSVATYQQQIASQAATAEAFSFATMQAIVIATDNQLTREAAPTVTQQMAETATMAAIANSTTNAQVTTDARETAVVVQLTATTEARAAMTKEARELATRQVAQTATLQAAQSATVQAEATSTSRTRQTATTQAQTIATQQVRQTGTAQARVEQTTTAKQRATSAAQTEATAQAIRQATRQAQSAQATAQAQANATAQAREEALGQLELFDFNQSIYGRLNPNGEQWFTFANRSGDTIVFFMYDPNVNIQDIGFTLYDQDTIPNWPPQYPDQLPNIGIGGPPGRDRDGDGGTGELIWRGSLFGDRQYYVRFYNWSGATVRYCITFRDLFDESCF